MKGGRLKSLNPQPIAFFYISIPMSQPSYYLNIHSFNIKLRAHYIDTRSKELATIQCSFGGIDQWNWQHLRRHLQGYEKSFWNMERIDFLN